MHGWPERFFINGPQHALVLASMSVWPTVCQSARQPGGKQKSQSIKNATTRTMSWQWDLVWLHLTWLLDIALLWLGCRQRPHKVNKQTNGQ